MARNITQPSSYPPPETRIDEILWSKLKGHSNTKYLLASEEDFVKCKAKNRFRRYKRRKRRRDKWEDTP